MRVSLNNHFFFTVVIGGDVCFDYIDLHWKGNLRLSALIGKGVVRSGHGVSCARKTRYLSTKRTDAGIVC
ncbi:hypothetical protein VIBNISOn1_p0193 [Vibrio nigripulchritudo SOn1]|uniref:Uncharacterized protein n=1 Tax=Vibrio nigripulchritudo SOn1 TaxID=1238450 RepID=A0AAV2W182_9VIBR|nr:hypothetical protein VIBNISOn1_p0193 [Vibrio nigripulchritudo SOn1]